MAPCLLLKRSPPQVGLIPGTARSAGQRLTYLATGAAICAKMKSAKVLGQTDQNLHTLFCLFRAQESQLVYLCREEVLDKQALS